MLQQYIRLMDLLYRLCLIVCSICVVTITLIIPWGVFTRYILGSAASWPEPMAILVMVVFSFFAAAVCYRDYLHIGVSIVPASLTGRAQTIVGWLIEACMIATNLFMLWYGAKLVHTTWNQVIADFPFYSVGLAYLPVPLGGAITLLFVIERLWTGRLFSEPSEDTISHISTE